MAIIDQNSYEADKILAVFGIWVKFWLFLYMGVKTEIMFFMGGIGVNKNNKM